LGFLREYFYSNEGNEPAHIHVRAGDKEAKLWLHDLSVTVNPGFAAHELGDISGIYACIGNHRLAAWNEHFGD
jgi:hypothetical protein